MKADENKGKKTITFYVDEEFHTAFKAESARAQSSMQAVMLKLVRDWLGNRGALPQAPSKRSSK